MQSPFVVSLFSIIPGLGFFVLRKFKIGFAVLGSMLLCFIIFVSSSDEMIYGIAFRVMIIIWFGQIFFAYREAKRMKEEPREKNYTPIAATTNEKIIYPSGLSIKEKNFYKAKEIVKRQAASDEQIYDVIVARVMPSIGAQLAFGYLSLANMHQFYLGNTSKGFILIDISFWNGKPTKVFRIPAEDIVSVEFKHGILNDKLLIIANDSQEYNCSVSYQFREKTEAIASCF